MLPISYLHLLALLSQFAAATAARDRSPGPRRTADATLGAPAAGRRRKLRAARVPRPLQVLCSEQTDRKREAALPSSSEEERPCQRENRRANRVMALSTPESDVELARRRREGVFTPPPHWKPRQEEVDLKKAPKPPHQLGTRA